jgi:proline iminopeptidase
MSGELYPPIEPHESGMLDVGDGHALYWEVCGDPEGKPAVVLHGGPGSGCTPEARRYFDPARYRVVLFDQRNAGRSLPSATEPQVDLSANTTQHLVADIERLRVHLGVDRWLVRGGSWGVTLALAYAEAHPGRVTELVLAAITNGTRREVTWMTRDMGRVFPREWEWFRDGVPAVDRHGDLPAAYGRLLHDPDPAVRAKAAQDWCDWEDTHVSLAPDHQPRLSVADAGFQLALARLVTHYWANDHFLSDGQLLRDAGRLAGIPGVLVHGRFDVSGPLDTAWALHRAWPDSELVVIGDAGHSGGSMAAAVVAATDRFADRR